MLVRASECLWVVRACPDRLKDACRKSISEYWPCLRKLFLARLGGPRCLWWRFWFWRANGVSAASEMWEWFSLTPFCFLLDTRNTRTIFTKKSDRFSAGNLTRVLFYTSFIPLLYLFYGGCKLTLPMSTAFYQVGFVCLSSRFCLFIK